MLNLRNSILYKYANALREFISWSGANYYGASPRFIKDKVLLRNAVTDELWVETGTYKGQTTLLLSKNSFKVITIEPQIDLYNAASKLFKNNKNIEIINGTSESVFSKLLPKINSSVNFWLDGHFSSGVTFKGENHSPIIQELKAISDNLNNFKNISVLIDDVRLCPSEGVVDGYPSLSYLVDWAQKYGFNWKIEHDIFVAKRLNK